VAEDRQRFLAGGEVDGKNLHPTVLVLGDQPIRRARTSPMRLPPRLLGFCFAGFGSLSDDTLLVRESCSFNTFFNILFPRFFL
jgi:hypothetical protein